MRAWVLLAVLLAGCLQGAPPAPSAPAPSPTGPGLGPEPAAADPADASAVPAPGPAPSEAASPPPPPAPTVADAGLAWSACVLRTNDLTYRHEWADGLVPPEYRQTNTIAGNLGEGLYLQLACDGMSVGNQTYIANGSLALVALKVEAPAGLQSGSGSNFYLIALAASDPGVARSLAALGAPASVGNASAGADGYGADAEGFAVAVQELAARGSVLDGSASIRFHWSVGGRHCWADTQHELHQDQATEVVFEGLRGAPQTVTGPLARSGGGGQRGSESGFLSPPACDGGSP